MKYLKEIGLFASYLFVLLACYLYDWKPFGVFSSYLFEIILLLFVYSFFRIRDQIKRPKEYKKQNSLGVIIVSVLPLIFIQYLIIGWMSATLDPFQDYFNGNILFTKELIPSFLALLIIYVLKARSISGTANQEKEFKNIFVYKVIMLTITNIIGVVLVLGIGIQSLLFVLTLMVIARILIELYFIKKVKSGQNSF